MDVGGGFLIMGVLGAAVGVGLALASKIFYVYVDPKIEAVSATMEGGWMFRKVWFRLMYQSWVACPSSCANVNTSLSVPLKLCRM